MNKIPNSKQLAQIRHLLISNPEIVRGTPVFNETRISVDLIAYTPRPGRDR